MSKLVGICGNIGAGKTTLLNSFSNMAGVEIIAEMVDENPFVAKFYDDMPRWAFHSQLRFLVDRTSRSPNADGLSISFQDRTIYEDIEVFAQSLLSEGILSRDEWNLYSDISKKLLDGYPQYGAIIYLKCRTETLFSRIISRGRPMELEIPFGYLKSLQGRYETLISRLSEKIHIIEVDTDKTDVADLENAASILEEVKSILH